MRVRILLNVQYCFYRNRRDKNLWNQWIDPWWLDSRRTKQLFEYLIGLFTGDLSVSSGHLRAMVVVWRSMEDSFAIIKRKTLSVDVKISAVLCRFDTFIFALFRFFSSLSRFSFLSVHDEKTEQQQQQRWRRNSIVEGYLYRI